jgi:aldose 1-epimerase
MTSTLTLAHGALRCTLLPSMGGSITGLWWDQQQLLCPDARPWANALQLASYPLLPYSNRVGYRRLHWAGQDYTLAENFPAEPHAIHGVGWQRAWTVESASSSQAVLTCQHLADEAWPFAFDSRQHIALTDQALELQLSITNRAGVDAPVGLGWHPYFAKDAHSRIAFAASGRWEMGSDKLPTSRRPHAGLDTSCAALDVDHCFDGWHGALHFSVGQLRLQLSSDLDCLVVYTRPELDRIAIEPVSHVNNALALAQQSGQSPQALGLRVLQPGETFGASMRIAIKEMA